MQWRNSAAAAAAVVCAAAVMAVGGPLGAIVEGQAPAPQGRGGGGGGRGNAGPAFFTAVDTNKDAAVTKDEMKAAFDKFCAKMPA